MAGESCGNHCNATRLVIQQACPLFILKLGTAGGFREARHVVRLGVAASPTMQASGFLKPRLGTTAAAHLALMRCGPGGAVKGPGTPSQGLPYAPEWLAEATQVML